MKRPHLLPSRGPAPERLSLGSREATAPGRREATSRKLEGGGGPPRPPSRVPCSRVPRRAPIRLPWPRSPLSRCCVLTCQRAVVPSLPLSCPLTPSSRAQPRDSNHGIPTDSTGILLNLLPRRCPPPLGAVGPRSHSSLAWPTLPSSPALFARRVAPRRWGAPIRLPGLTARSPGPSP